MSTILPVLAERMQFDSQFLGQPIRLWLCWVWVFSNLPGDGIKRDPVRIKLASRLAIGGRENFSLSRLRLLPSPGTSVMFCLRISTNQIVGLLGLSSLSERWVFFDHIEANLTSKTAGIASPWV